MEDEQIREKSEALWPEVIGLVITKRGDKLDVCPVNFQAVSTVYEKPLSVCIGLANGCYTLENVLDTREFVYAYPDKDQAEQVMYCGRVSGRDEDKLKYAKFQFHESKKVKPPSLVGAVLNCECRVVHVYDAGTFTIVIGSILNLNTSDKSNLDKIYSLGGEGEGFRVGVIKNIDTVYLGR